MKKSGRVDQFRLAILTHGFDSGGGVPTVTRWLRNGLIDDGRYSVDVIDLATSMRDLHSRRIASPRTWAKPSLRSEYEPNFQRCGANAVELEFMRYRPRRELTKLINEYDLVQVVAGSPAWGGVTANARIPVVLQVATTVAWERKTALASDKLPRRLWRDEMTRRATIVERLALRHADAVMVENDLMLQHVRGLGQKRVSLAPPGVDTNRFSPDTLGLRQNTYMLSVCRLGDPRKGLDRLIRIYAHMLRRYPTTPKLILAGKGSITPSTAHEIRRLGLSESVEIRKDVSEEALPGLYRGASIFLQTSHEEGLGLSLLEAMSSGLPVVATETAGSRETVAEGITGYLISQTLNDSLETTFADRAVQLLSQDGERFGANGRHRCLEKFSTTAALKKFTEIYADLGCK